MLKKLENNLGLSFCFLDTFPVSAALTIFKNIFKTLLLTDMFQKHKCDFN